jgi:hypothetical protein
MSRLQNYSPNENKKVHVERDGVARPATLIATDFP